MPINLLAFNNPWIHLFVSHLLNSFSTFTNKQVILFIAGPVHTSLMQNWPGMFGTLLRFVSRNFFKTPEEASKIIISCVCDGNFHSAGTREQPFCNLLPTASKGWEGGNSFSLLVCPNRGGGRGYPKVPTPHPRYLPPGPRYLPPCPRYLPPPCPRYLPSIQGTYPPPSKVPTPHPRYLPPVQSTYPLPMYLSPSKVPTPSPVQGTYPPPHPRYLPPQSKVPTPPHPRYLPPSKVPTLPLDRTAYRVLHTLRSVCLLCSCRRTFLFH